MRLEEEERNAIAYRADMAICKIVGLRQSMLQLADLVHHTYHGTSATHLWRRCKDPVCRKFLQYVKEDGKAE